MQRADPALLIKVPSLSPRPPLQHKDVPWRCLLEGPTRHCVWLKPGSFIPFAPVPSEQGHWGSSWLCTCTMVPLSLALPSCAPGVFPYCGPPILSPQALFPWKVSEDTQGQGKEHYHQHKDPLIAFYKHAHPPFVTPTPSLLSLSSDNPQAAVHFWNFVISKRCYKQNRAMQNLWDWFCPAASSKGQIFSGESPTLCGLIGQACAQLSGSSAPRLPEDPGWFQFLSIMDKAAMHRLSVPWDQCTRMQSLDRMVIASLALWETAKLLSRVNVPFYTPTSNVRMT